MARNLNVQNTLNRHSRVTTAVMKEVPLFDGLIEDQLNQIAQMSTLLTLDDAKVNRVIGNGNAVLVVLDGIIKLVSNDAKTADKFPLISDRPIIRRLNKNNIYGSVWSPLTAEILIVADSACRLLVIPQSIMRSFCFDWPELLTSYTRELELIAEEVALKTAESAFKLADTERVLGRIDDVANLLIQGGVGGSAIPPTIQKKFKLNKMPKTGLGDLVIITQAYLPSSATIGEDRIRSVKNSARKTLEFFRTRRWEDDGKRKEYPERIGSEDYSRLLQRAEGNEIVKERYSIDMQLPGIKVTVDKFIYPRKGLVLLEATADSDEVISKFSGKDIKKLDSTINAADVSDDKQYSNKTLAKL